MTAEAGLAALWLAAAFAGLQLALAVLALTRAGAGGAPLRAAVRPVAVVQGLLAVAALILLIRLFLISDMSVTLVVEHSHSLTPWLGKLAGAWGSPAGSLLLGVGILGLAGGAVALFERRLDESALIAALGAQAALALGGYVWLLFGATPFARVAVAPVDGTGLDPVAWSLGAAFGLPALYVGWASLAVGLSFVVGSLVTRGGVRDTLGAMRLWVLAGWVFLTLGITAHSYAAYHGPGGWGPAVTISLTAWLAATGLLHWGSEPPTLEDAPEARRLSLQSCGSALAHIGAAIAVAGIVVAGLFSVERPVAVGANEPQRIGPYTVTLDGIRPVIGPNWSALEAHLTARRGDGAPVVLRPQSRYYAAPPASIGVSAVASGWDGSLHTMIGRPQGGGRWGLRLGWTPFAAWLWLGGGLMALGGAMSLVARLRSERLNRERDYWA